MTPKETAAALAYIGTLWPRHPMDVQRCAPAWHGILGEHEAARVRDAIDAHARASQWPPTIADLVALLEPRDDAPRAFAAVVDALAYPVDQRSGRVSPRALEAVRRLGGWGAVGQWRSESMGFHLRDFERVYGEVRPESIERALAGPESGAAALPAMTGPESEKRGTGESGASDGVEQKQAPGFTSPEVPW